MGLFSPARRKHTSAKRQHRAPGVLSTRGLARRSPVLRALASAGRFVSRLARQDDELVGKILSRIVNVNGAGRPVYVEGNRAQLAREGYCRSSLVHACCVEFATSVAEPPLIAKRGGKVLDPATDLLAALADAPNPEMTVYDYTERIATDMKIYGEAIVQLRRSDKGIIRELWPVRVDRTEVIPAEDGTILRYEVDGKELKPRDVMHIKYPNPLSDYRGLSPIYVLLMEGQLDRDALTYLGDFFANGGLPSAIITSTAQLQPEERIDIAREFDETYSVRSGNSGGAFVLSSGGTIQPFGVDPGKLQLDAIFDVSESRVCAVMGCPAILVGVMAGLKQSQAYGTAREARRGWWGETLVPFMERLNQIHTLRIAREFGPGYSLKYDLSDVQALLEARGQVMRDATSAWALDAITRDEVRERCGLPPIDHAPVFRYQLKAGTMTEPKTANPEAGTGAAASRTLPTLVGNTEAA